MKNNLKRKNYLIYVFVVLIAQTKIACTTRQVKEESIDNHSIKFDSICLHFERLGDTLGVNASKFLLHNIANKYAYQKVNGDKVFDNSAASASYIIKSIEDALKVSREDLCSGKIKMEDFFDYILPYRFVNEPLVDWRTHSRSMFAGVAESRTIYKEPVDFSIFAASEINKYLQGSFKFRNNFVNANVQTWHQLIHNRSGDCAAMANTIIYPLRAMGVPVSVDFCTSWANINGGGHTWNTLISSNKTIPFLAFEGSPPNYDPFGIYGNIRKKPAKVFRRRFSINRSLLHNVRTSTEYIPKVLDFEDATDVTSDYCKTQIIRLFLRGNNRPQTAYLSIFKDGEVTPVFWAKGVNGEYLFEQMPEGILYIPIEWKHTETVQLHFPFSMEHGIVRIYKPDTRNLISVIIKETNSKEQFAVDSYARGLDHTDFISLLDSIQNEKKISAPNDLVSYELSYWDGRWVHLAQKAKASGGVLRFNDVPNNTIYRLESPKDKNVSRVFSYLNGKQIWW